MDAQAPRPGRCPISATSSHAQPRVNVDDFEKVPAKPVSRRDLLKVGGVGVMASTFATVGSLTWQPKRVAHAMANVSFPDTQFDIGAFVHPAQTINGIPVDFGVLFTFMSPAVLTRNPTKADQQVLANALTTIEAHFDFSPSGIFTFVSYGLPYFNRLPASLVKSRMPLRNDNSGKPVLEEAVASPTDFGVPGISKLQANFRVPVQIEHNDVLFIMRSDSLANITNASAWLNGSNTLNGNNVPSPNFNGLFSFQPSRLNFVQPGLPRQLADNASSQGMAPFTTIATEINPASSMWMGFVDQQTDSSAPNGATVTFAGAVSGGVKLTTANAGDYFDHGSIVHLSHDLDDLEQFYTKQGAPNFPDGPEVFDERVQYMFRSSTADGFPGLPFPVDPNDPFTNGGGLGAPTGNLATQQQSAFVKNVFSGPTAIQGNFDPAVTDHHKYRVGHEQALQRSSRAVDGTPLHIRNDGPGLSSLDVPDGSTQPTLEFLVFVPTAEFFRVMRINAASLDYVKAGDNGGTATSVAAGIEAADAGDDGVERFISATRRQNFLIPPRRHRAFPLLELT